MSKKNKKIKKKSITQQVEPAVPTREDLKRSMLRRLTPFLFISVPGIIVIGIVWYFLGPAANRNYSAGAFKDCNVLLITIDTLRADHLPMYGYGNVKTPSLEKMAADSLVFEDAIAHVPITLPSHTSILTGLLPIAHGILDNGGFFLDPQIVTLPEILKENGYATAAFVSGFVLHSRWQLNQGFDLYFDNFDTTKFEEFTLNELQRRAEETEIEVEHWLSENKSRRFFCWVHFYDPHEPYDPPEPYRTEYSDRLYDGEIAYTDEVIGKLLSRLTELQLEERTIVIVTGDHGEGLGDHSELTHALFIYQTTQHIPLLVRLPKGSRQRIKGVVSHIDIAPTILEWLAFQPPDAMQGKSLVPMLKGKEKNGRVAFSESVYSELHYGWSPLKGLTTDNYKFIEAPKPELYDRLNDPKELNNLVDQKPHIAKALKEQLHGIIGKFSAKEMKGPEKLDPDTEEKLRALGYIGGTVQSTPESRKIDPKDKIHLQRAIQLAFKEAVNKNYRKALEIIMPVLTEDPGMIDAHFTAGVSFAGLQEYNDAIDELMKTIALRPDHAMALHNLGWVYEMKGNLREAETWYKKVLQYEKNFQTKVKLAHLYRRMNEMDKSHTYFLEGIQSFEESLRQIRGAKNRSDVFSTLGELYFGAGDLNKAEENFKSAIELTPNEPVLHFNLAQIYEARGDMAGATLEYEKETQIGFKAEAYVNLGLLYRKAGRIDKSNDCFQKVLENQSQNPFALYLLAENYYIAGVNLQEALKLAETAVAIKGDFRKGYLLLAAIYEKLGRVKDARETIQKAGGP